MIARWFFWILTALVAVTAVAVLAFRLSPWPSVMVIQHMFSRGDSASEAALERHVPPGVTTRRDLAYGPGRDEVFDINYPEGTDAPLPTIVWVHGGAWIAGSKDGIANYLKVLAGHGYTTVGVEYATGFGAPYPGPVEQVNAALGHLRANADALNIDADAIVLAGDSAGAQIVAQLAIISTDPDYAGQMAIAPTLPADGLAGVMLLSGAYDMRGVPLDGEYGWLVRAVLWAYSGSRDFLNDPRFGLISVARYVTGEFPPAFISSGNGDPLAPQAVTLARRLEELGVEVDSLFFPPDHEPELPHEYQFNLDIEPGQVALERMLGFVAARTGR